MILIDDGSTDSSGSICDRYQSSDSRVRVEHTLNRGVSMARNRGIELSQGRWISFVDSDDFVSSDYIQAFDELPQIADLTYFGNECLYEQGVKSEYRLPESLFCGWDEIQEGMFRLKSNIENYDYYGYTWNKFFRSEIIKKYNVRFDSDLTFKEDEIFTDNYIVHCDSLSFINKTLYSYRILQTGLTASEKTIECMRLYVSEAEKMIGWLTNRSLLQYQINYIFHKRREIIHRCGGRNGLDNKQFLAFISKYERIGRDACKHGKKTYCYGDAIAKLLDGSCCVCCKYILNLLSYILLLYYGKNSDCCSSCL